MGKMTPINFQYLSVYFHFWFHPQRCTSCFPFLVFGTSNSKAIYSHASVPTLKLAMILFIFDSMYTHCIFSPAVSIAKNRHRSYILVLALILIIVARGRLVWGEGGVAELPCAEGPWKGSRAVGWSE